MDALEIIEMHGGTVSGVNYRNDTSSDYVTVWAYFPTKRSLRDARGQLGSSTHYSTPEADTRYPDGYLQQFHLTREAVPEESSE